MWGLWLLRHSLGQEPWAGWWPWGRGWAEGKRSGGVSVSMVLTSQAHRRCMPERNRSIPTISVGCFGGRLVHVSAVDTGPRGSESGLLTAEPGAVAVWNHRHSCLRPCVVCRTQPPPPGGPSHVTNVMTSNIELYLAPARRPASHGSTPTPPAPSRLRPSRPTPRGSGSTGHGLCVLHEGPTYPQYPRPSSSGTPPSCSAPKRRQQAPEQLRAVGSAPPEKRAVAPAHGRPTPPAS